MEDRIDMQTGVGRSPSGFHEWSLGMTAVFTRPAVGVTACCFLMAMGAHVRVILPGTDVPMTLQLLGVLFTGYVLSPRRAVAAALLYVAGGTVGLPMFAPGSEGLAGLTGGYIVGFVAAAWMLSVLTHGRSRGLLRLAGAGTAALAVVFVLGVGWRVVLLGDVRAAVLTGFVPFALKAVVELIMTLALVVGLRRWQSDLKRRRAS